MQVYRPLELDTDGIWCCLPGSFPEEFKFIAKGGKVHKINYPGLMLNVMCADNNTNDQYHDLVTREDGSKAYQVSSQMSIEFEVDGPYLVCALRTNSRAALLAALLYLRGVPHRCSMFVSLTAHVRHAMLNVNSRPTCMLLRRMPAALHTCQRPAGHGAAGEQGRRQVDQEAVRSLQL